MQQKRKLKELKEPPEEELVLRHVLGTSGRPILVALGGWKIAFAASALVVIMRALNAKVEAEKAPKQSEQTFFRGHSDEVTFICSGRQGSIVASAEMGFNPRILVWDSSIEHVDTGYQVIAPDLLMLERSSGGMWNALAGAANFWRSWYLIRIIQQVYTNGVQQQSSANFAVGHQKFEG